MWIIYHPNVFRGRNTAVSRLFDAVRVVLEVRHSVLEIRHMVFSLDVVPYVEQIVAEAAHLAPVPRFCPAKPSPKAANNSSTSTKVI